MAPTPTANLIKEARVRKGLTRLQVAQTLGTTIPTVCRWETGRHEPAWPLRARLAEILDLPALVDV